MNASRKLSIPLTLLSLGLGCWTAAAATDVILSPGAIQPGGDPNDTELHWAQYWADTGTASEEFDSTMHSASNVPGSIHVTFDCQGAVGQDPSAIKSANLAFGTYFLGGSGGWLGQDGLLKIDASQYESVSFNINVATTVSSNTVIPLTLYGAGYGNVHLIDLPITNSGWQKVVVPIPATINLSDCVSFGIYDWYNTTAGTPPAHVEFWIDSMKITARQAVIPPPKLSLLSVSQRGLMLDSGLSETGVRSGIDTVQDVAWSGHATTTAPVTYSMTLAAVPDLSVNSNYEAHIFLAPSSGVGNPDWNLSDMGYLQILANSDGSATARMMWKTNEPFGNTMLFNNVPGGDSGTNGYAAGTLGYLNAPSVVGTWSVAFKNETDFEVRGPGGVSTNYSLPAAWVASLNNLGGSVYACFGGSPGAGESMTLSSVSVTGGVTAYAFTNDFSTTAIDTTVWGLLGTETAVVPPGGGWLVSWTLPAVNFTLCANANLGNAAAWSPITGNTNLPVPVTTYTAGTNYKAFVASTNLPSADFSFFCLRKLEAAKLQVLLPGESNAPGTATGKTGSPTAQTAGVPVTVTVNAVDANWNIVTYSTDTVSLTSSDASATDDNLNPLPLSGALAQGSRTFNVIFSQAGSPTVTASDTTQTTVASATSSAVRVN